MSQSICRYYLNGTCKFGNRCRYLHPAASSPHQNAEYNQQNYGRNVQQTPQWNKANFNSPSASNRFAVLADNKALPSATNDVFDVNQILQTVSQEMAICQLGKIWPCSSFGYLKHIPNLPGLDDISQEEVRYQAYSARDENKFDQYVAWYGGVMAEYNHKHSILARPNHQQRQILLDILNKINAKTMHLIDSKDVDSLFTRSQATSSNAFARSSTVFPSQQQTDAAAFFKQAASGMTVQGPEANKPSFGSSVFGGAFQATNSPSGFPSTNSNQPKDLPAFGSAFQSAGNPSGFSNTNSATSNPVNPSQFGGALQTPNNQSGFTSGNNPSPFGGAFQPTNSQSGATSVINASSNTVSLPQGSSSSGTVSTPANSLYTPLSELTDEEKQQFQAAKFEFGKIPTRPPPVELIQ